MSTIRVARAVACSVALGIAVCQAGPASAAAALDPGAPPGSNFDLSVWELQEPTGSPGSPTTISPSRLEGGYTDKYFYTDSGDGSMTFWDPENGVTTPNSNYSRSELREMTSGGKAAAWAVSGTHKLNASVKVTEVPDHVCVGQIHLAEGSGSTKPLVELYYYSNGDLKAGIENSPSGGQTQHSLGNVPLNTKWSYTISLTGGNTIGVTVNGKTSSFPMPSSFKSYPMYFKAGDYDQSSGSSSTVGARVHFYSLSVSHS
ncbi:polysaccharide lyase family 7 protein [Amycolatopsis sp. NPDC051903]|uniref:polysaccharide lyase family 7 protein n=1 Tax=Amycolatopsis sp. NPDC051903 TaxID=3363936 RepID=UPI00379FD868